MQVVIFLHPIQLGISLSENKQWGKSSSNIVTFPIAFNDSPYIAVNSTNHTGSGENYDNVVTEMTKTTLTIRFGAFRYICVGKQQWGKFSGKSASQPVTYPIAFTSFVIPIAVVTGYTDVRAVMPEDITLKNCNLRTSASAEHDTYGIFIGKQQWGFVRAGQKVNVTFPIAFTNKEYAVVFNGEYSSDIEYYDMLTTSRSTSGYTLFVGGSNSGGRPNKRYIAVGYQQWGYYNTNSNSNTASGTVKYPISFNESFALLINGVPQQDSAHGIVQTSQGNFTRTSFNYWHTSYSGNYGTKLVFFWIAAGR